MKRHYYDYLKDISDYGAESLEFINGMSFEEFITDKRTKYAVFRALEVIGEAAKHIPIAFRKKFPNIEWKKIACMRDKLIHEYSGVNYHIVWETVKTSLPILLLDIQALIKKYKSENPDLFKNIN